MWKYNLYMSCNSTDHSIEAQSRPPTPSTLLRTNILLPKTEKIVRSHNLFHSLINKAVISWMIHNEETGVVIWTRITPFPRVTSILKVVESQFLVKRRSITTSRNHLKLRVTNLISNWIGYIHLILSVAAHVIPPKSRQSQMYPTKSLQKWNISCFSARRTSFMYVEKPLFGQSGHSIGGYWKWLKQVAALKLRREFSWCDRINKVYVTVASFLRV